MTNPSSCRQRFWKISLAGVLGLGGPVLAADPLAETGAGVFTLGTVNVTAAREQVGEMPQDQVGSLITQREMRQFRRETVGDALSLLPGVTLSNNSRNEQLIYVRGFDSRQVPLFIDGIPVYVPYDGYVDFARFSTYDISATQVAKGFSSVAYGPNALGGAINLVSRKPRRPFEGDAFIGFGASADRQAGVNLGTRQGIWYAQLGLSYREADGFRLPGDFKPTATEDGGLRDNSARRDSKVSFKIGLTPNASDEYALSYYKQDGRKGQPPSTDPASARYWRWPYWDKESLYFVSTTALGQHETAKLRLYHDRFDNEVDTYTNGSYSVLKTNGQGSVSTGRSIYHDQSFGGGLELVSTRFAPHTLRAVVQHKTDRHREEDARAVVGTRYEDQVRSVGVEDLIALGDRWQLSLGMARHELQPDEIFNASSKYALPSANRANNLQVGLFYDLAEGSRLYATVARKTRLPTLKDRYSQRLGNYVQNPALGAERSLNAELGYQGRPFPGVTMEAALFHSRIDDKIQSVFIKGGSSCSPATPCQMRNVGEARVSGVEFGVRATATRWLDVGGNLTVLHQENVSNPSVKLTGVPDRKLMAWAAVRPTERLDIQLSLEHNSRRWVSNTQQIAGFTVAGLKASYRPQKGLSVTVGVDNLTDKLYELDAGFPASGRAWFVQLRHEF